jgi:uncharacterized protein (TIGR02996 family)
VVSMSTDAAFLAAIAANPVDHLPKLVYADWLEERNDPRAEFLRVQYALTQAPSLNDEWWRLHTRRAEAASTLDASWLRAASVGLEWIDEIRDGSDLHQRIPQAAEAGNPAAMTNLAIHYWNSIPEHQPRPKLWVAVTSLAARIWNDGEQRRDYRNARKWLQRAVDAGHAPAMYLLGVMYQLGLGMWDNDPKKAAKLYRRAADLGFARATVELAMMYAAGEGVRQNTAKAVLLYQLAAGAGEGKAHRILGNRFRDGRGVPKDVGEAVKRYRRAIELGEDEARQPLADLLWKHPKLAE